MSPFELRLALLLLSPPLASSATASTAGLSFHGSWESGVVLVKLSPAAGFVSGPTHLAAGEESGLVLGAVAHFLLSGVEHLSPVIPDFDPKIRDRWGNPILAADGTPLTVPNDLSRWVRARLSPSLDEMEVASALLAAPQLILAAEPNYRRQTDDASTVVSPLRRSTDGSPAGSYPNDTYFFPHQWGFENVGQYCGVPGADINAVEAWNDFGVGSFAADTRVAILDTGIDPAHPDISFVASGANFVAPGVPPSDDHGHGTACAGLVAMTHGNGRGGAGVASGVTLVPVKVLDAAGYGWVDQIVQGIDWCRTQGIPIISMSYGADDPAGMEEEALQNARAAGMVCVGAAGNLDGTTPHYPAAYKHHVVAVNAYLNNDQRWRDEPLGGPAWQGSTFGDWLDLTAPGGRGIMTTKRHTVGNGYYDLGPLDPWDCSDNDWILSNGFGGTSAACPVAAGVAASILAHAQDLDGEDAQTLMMLTARDFIQYEQGWDQESGWGSPDLAEALRYASPPYVVERGTHSGGTVINDGDGEAWFLNVPGIGTQKHQFKRRKVERTIPFSTDFLANPLAWGRVQGSVGWRYIWDGEIFNATANDAGYAVVSAVSPTSVTIRTWYYEIYNLSGQHVGNFPNNGDVAMSFTAVGPTVGVSGVEDPVLPRSIVVRPNPAVESCVLGLGASGELGTVRVFDAAGREVRAIASAANTAAVEWDLRDDSGVFVPAGVYFARLEVGGAPMGTGRIQVIR